MAYSASRTSILNDLGLFAGGEIMAFFDLGPNDEMQIGGVDIAIHKNRVRRQNR
jgi:hypothetical protein